MFYRKIYLTTLEESNLIILTKLTESWDTFSKFHHILNGIGQPHRTVLPHLIHRLQTEDRERERESEKCCTHYMSKVWLMFLNEVLRPDILTAKFFILYPGVKRIFKMLHCLQTSRCQCCWY